MSELPTDQGATRRLRAFQREDIAFFRRHNYRAINANSPGTGKTIECLACIAQEGLGLLPAVVIAPSSVLRNWYREAKKWLGSQTKVQIVRSLSVAISPEAHLIVLSWALLPLYTNDIVRREPKLVIADEAHYAKNPGSQRGAALIRLAQAVPHIFLLTGTPLVNSVEELWVLQAIFGKKAPPMSRRMLEDVEPDLPPKERAYLYINLRDKDQVEYTRAETDFANWIESYLQPQLGRRDAEAKAVGLLTQEALAKVGYLRRLLGQAKVYAAAEWIGRAVRNGEPVVVFAEHQEVLRRLERLLSKQRVRHLVIEGKTPRKKRQQAIDRFQAGELPVILASKAAKEGITLTRARHLLFVERYFTAADEEQAEGRIWRIGQDHAATIWYLHVPRTIDDRIDEIVEKKRRLVRRTIGDTTVAEQDESVVEALVAHWGAQTRSTAQDVSTLGRTKNPLRPMPLVHEVAYFMVGPWPENRVRAWMKLHGYRPVQFHATDTGWHVQIHPLHRYVTGSFRSVPVLSDLIAMCGTSGSTPAKARRQRVAMLGDSLT